jgi:catechol 2,3-dioxygenase-like lactoylglutathione lyase family enzyme
MFDHVTIRVTDRAASERYYNTVLRPLAIDQSYRTNAFSEWGQFELAAADAGRPTEHVHMAFGTDDDADVQRFHKAATAAGYRSRGAPGERPRYHPGYYAAYVFDPDGNDIKVVNHHRV